MGNKNGLLFFEGTFDDRPIIIDIHSIKFIYKNKVYFKNESTYQELDINSARRLQKIISVQDSTLK